MALMIQVPPERQSRASDDNPAHRQRNTDQRGWHSQIDLDIAGLGRVKASLWMQAAGVEIDLGVADARAYQSLEKGLDRLRSRLTVHGFDEIKLDLHRLDEAQRP